MRRFALALAALVMVLGGTIAADSRPAHALAGACYWSDSTGVVYADGDNVSGAAEVYNSNTGHTFHVVSDIHAYRFGGNDGHCYRAYDVGVWNTDGWGYGEYSATLRQWVCGNYEGDVTGDAQGVYANSTWSIYGSFFLYVNTDNNNWHWLKFTDYGAGPGCGRQADNYTTFASNGGWDKTPSATPPIWLIYANWHD